MTGRPETPADHKTRIDGACDKTVLADPSQVLRAHTVLSDAEQTILSPSLPCVDGGDLLAPGDLINNNYRIVKLISSGGMGEVYRGANQFTGDPVAIKVILPELARDPAVVALFKREARILGQLGDNAIVRYHNFILDPDLNRYCLVMEHVEGRSLLDRVRNEGPLPPRDARFLMRRLANGLARVHQHNVIHRDLSPDNVILRNNRVDDAVLIDFGIARPLSGGDGLGGRFAGKYRYIAPEQLGHFKGHIDARTDIYGLALMMVAVLRGEPPKMGGTAVEASARRRHIPDLSGIEPRLMPLLQYMLEPDPAARPASMESVIAMLDDPGRVPLLYRVPLWHSARGGDRGGRLHSRNTLIPKPQLDGLSGLGRLRYAWPLWLGLLVSGAAMLAWSSMHPSGGKATPDQGPGGKQAVLPVGWPARDMSSRDGFLAEHDLPPCSFASRVTSGPQAGQIGLLADGPRDTSGLVNGYEERFGVRPGTAAHLVTPRQCAVVDLLHLMSGRHFLPPLVALDDSSDINAVSGAIRNVSGMSLWLFLASPEGRVYDLTSSAQRQMDGTYRFRFGLRTTNASDGTYLLVGVTSAQPLTQTAAIVPGMNAEQLMPLIAQEILEMGGEGAADFVAFQMKSGNLVQP